MTSSQGEYLTGLCDYHEVIVREEAERSDKGRQDIADWVQRQPESRLGLGWELTILRALDGITRIDVNLEGWFADIAVDGMLIITWVPMLKDGFADRTQGYTALYEDSLRSDMCEC